MAPRHGCRGKVPSSLPRCRALRVSLLNLQNHKSLLLGWRPSLVGWRPWFVGWRPSLLGWRPSLLGWRPSLLGWRPLHVSLLFKIKVGQIPSEVGVDVVHLNMQDTQIRALSVAQFHDPENPENSTARILLGVKMF